MSWLLGILLWGTGCKLLNEGVSVPVKQAQEHTNVHAYAIPAMDGTDVPLSKYKGKTVMIVNTASKCGFTPQYDGLEKVYNDYKDKGLVILGLPCNDFGGQESGSDEEIATFCRKNYGVTFPIFSKVHAVGDKQLPLYRALSEDTAPDIKGPVQWNFTKFLVDPSGNVVARFGPRIAPEDAIFVATLEKHLP
ncbi:MAG: glutathione peroxidase [Myxococcota bacterium]|nr:glutathione peroxidase [Myxococcota bacterium]